MPSSCVFNIRFIMCYSICSISAMPDDHSISTFVLEIIMGRSPSWPWSIFQDWYQREVHQFHQSMILSQSIPQRNGKTYPIYNLWKFPTNEYQGPLPIFHSSPQRLCWMMGGPFRLENESSRPARTLSCFSPVDDGSLGQSHLGSWQLGSGF